MLYPVLRLLGHAVLSQHHIQVTLAARVLRHDIVAMVLQVQVNEMLKDGWLMRPWNEGAISLVKQHGAGTSLRHSLCWTRRV